MRFLFDSLGGEEQRLALVRMYKTHRYGDLPSELREHAARASTQRMDPGTRCLVLLASAGVEDAWNDPRRSRGHRVIPLASPEGVARWPMILALIRQLGHDVATLTGPAPKILVDGDQRSVNVFHVEDAAQSDDVPEKDFVRRYGISSLLGFGGVVPPGEFFATILFSRTPITRAVAELFAPIALSIKLQLLPFSSDGVLA